MFERAKLAVEEYKRVEEEEEEKLEEITNEIGKIIEGRNKELPTVSEAMAKGEEFTKEENKEIVDEYNNHLIIPKGFHIVENGKDDVEYNYTGKEDKIPTVQDGIVIEDSEGNQFVWIPVGEINNKEESEEKTTKITLGRYTFGEGGIPSSAYNGNYEIESSSYNYIEENEEEHKRSQYKNSIAKDIEGFKTSAEINHGYYIARYEAGNNNGKITSKQGLVWGSINQPAASTAAREMYESNEYESDLVNSYAWDTAIIFIQTYSEKRSYSLENSQKYSSMLRNTGEINNSDKVCNIFDMASNYLEWTTETCKDNSGPCGQRGGCCRLTNDYTSRRYCGTYVYTDIGLSFRVILYIL